MPWTPPCNTAYLEPGFHVQGTSADEVAGQWLCTLQTDITKLPLAAACLISLTDTEHLLLTAFHHQQCDM